MRSKRSKQKHCCLKRRAVNTALRLREGNEVVRALHESGDDCIQAELFKTLRDHGNHLMPCADEFLCFLHILVLIFHNKVIEPAQETVHAVDTAVIPLCVKFGRTYEQLIHTQGITAVILNKIIRRNNVAF